MYLYDVEVEILVNGKPVKKYSHNGQTFVQANVGSSYSIKLRNLSHKRRMFVCSVDGINVVNGKPAGSSQIGYVLNGYATYEVQGFRTSNDNVNLFKFAKKARSYAAKSDETGGDTSNCGVIGVEVYDEKEQPVITFPTTVWHTYIHSNYPRRYGDMWGGTYTVDASLGPEGPIGPQGVNGMNLTYSASAGGGGTSSSTSDSGPMRCASTKKSMFGEKIGCYHASNASDQKISAHFCAVAQDAEPFSVGTEFSKEEVLDKVTDTQFDIGSLVVSMSIYYDTREGLIAQGVPVLREVKIAAMPQAFPSKFCKPPRR